MDDAKRILVFSDAGGTGRSYHAELSARNRSVAGSLSARARLEGGCRHSGPRPHQPHQPGAAAAVPADRDGREGREALSSTIARRLDTLGAITRGQRQTGGQGLFQARGQSRKPLRPRRAAPALSCCWSRGKVEGCSLERFEDATGLKLTDANGIKDELPPITTFLNRLLALTIDLQNVLFISASSSCSPLGIEGAIASGTYDAGLETLRAESFVVADRRVIYTHPATGAETRLLTITERRRNRPVTLGEALDRLSGFPRASC